MRVAITIILFLLSSSFAAGGVLSTQLYHETPEPALLGENIRLELNVLNNSQPIYNAQVFFRMEGQAGFRSQRLRREGMLLFAELPTKKLQPGRLEYFFAFQNTLGEALFLPEQNPEVNPLALKILPAKETAGLPVKNEFEILMLSPDAGDLIKADELLIALALPLSVDNPQNLKYKLEINGVDVSKLLKQAGNLITFAPKTIRAGQHNAEFKVFDVNGVQLAEKELTFRISGITSSVKDFKYNGSLFLDNRYQNVGKASDDFFRGGFNFYGNYQKLDFQTRLLISSEESARRQPINQYGVGLRYHFTARSDVYLNGGDFAVNYDPLSLWEQRIRGIGGGFNTPYMNLDITYGQTARGIEGTTVIIGGGADSVLASGTYQQKFFSIRPEFNFGRYANWAFNLINSKDDTASIKYGGNPKEALVVGTSLRLAPHPYHFEMRASVQASMKNEDAKGKVNFDSIASKYDLKGSQKDLAEKASNFFENTGFLTLSQGLSPLPSMAMQFEAQLNYFNHSLRAIYKKIEAEYTTPGNPYLLKDIAGFFINDNIRLLENQVFLNVYFNSYQDNLSADEAKTKNTEVGGSISYFPFQNLPSVTLSYGNQTRKNELAENNVHPDSTFLLLEDNATQRIGLSASYQFALAGLSNTFSFSASKFKRDDAAYAANQSDFNLYTIGLRNQFSFPLTTRLSYSKTTSDFGKDTTASGTDINKYYLGADYLIRNLFWQSDVRPFVNATIQKITETGLSAVSYNRFNYSAGFYLINENRGNLSLRYDYIDFGDKYGWSDSIVNARYEVNF